MKVIKKNKIIFYSLLFGIIFTGSICMVFVIKNSIITDEKILRDLEKEVIYIKNEKYILNNIRFNLKKVKELSPYTEKNIYGVLQITKENEEISINIEIKYIREKSKWLIKEIIYWE